MDTLFLDSRVRALEDEENLIRRYFYWVPPVYDIPPGAEISPEEQRIEDQLAKKYPNRGPPMWSSGGWLPKPDADDERYQKATGRDSTRKRPLEISSGNASKRIKSLPESNLALAVDHHEAVQVHHSPYICDPVARVMQCVRVLCGNNGVLVDDFISLYIAQMGISNIINMVLGFLDTNFLELLKLPQCDRVAAIPELLMPLDIDADSKCVYLAVVKLPPKAAFWKSCRHAYPEDSVDEARFHDIMYAGSAAGEGNGTKGRVRKQHENKDYRESHPSLFYKAFDEPGATHLWFRVTVAENEEIRAAIRITEAVAVACLHTYTSPVYTQMLKDYGIVERDAEAFGLNRTSAMKDSIYQGRSYTDSAEQRILYQMVLEDYGGLIWTPQTLPDIVQRWLSAEGFEEATTLALPETHGKSLAKAIHSEMCKKGGTAGASGRRELMIQHALAGGLFNVNTAKGDVT